MEERSPEKRQCVKCGKILAEANRGPECFSCHRPKVIDMDCPNYQIVGPGKG